MAYIKTSWVARVGTALNRFLKTNESAGSVELTNDPTGVTTAGTPFTVANMNKIEQGIYDAHVGLDNNINQNVKTTASPTFANATIAGHNIDSELDTLNGRVNQGVKTTDSPTFANMLPSRYINLTLSSNYNMPEMSFGESCVFRLVGNNSTGRSVYLPPGGTYYVIVFYSDPTASTLSVKSGGSLITNIDNNIHGNIIIWRVA